MLDLVIVIAFLLANLLIGYYSSKGITSFSIFSVGHRSFSSFFIFCTLSATFIGGGYTFGNAASVFSHGMVYAFALLGFSVKEMLVATVIAPRMARYNDCHSVGDMMQKTYGVAAKVATGIFTLIICGGILGAQVGALATIIHSTLHMNITLGIIISFAVLLIYSSMGGMRAVVFTDTLQAIILFIGIPLVFFYGLYHVGGWHKVTLAVPTSYFHFLSNRHEIIFFVLMFFTFMFGETLVPPYVQRLFMASSTQHTSKGIFVSGLVSIPMFLIAGGIGLVAFAANKHIDPNLAFPYLVEMLPIGVRGFVIAALLSIILSSAAGFLNAAAISFVNDLVKPFHKNDTKKDYLRMARVSTMLVGIISLIFALTISNVLSILLMAYNFWSPIIIVPLVAAVFGIKANGKTFFIGAGFGIAGTLVWQFILQEPLGVTPLLFGIVCNLMAFAIAQRCLPAQPNPDLQP